MDLSQKISTVAAKTPVGKHEALELNKVYPIIGAARFFTTKVLLLFKTSEHHATILYSVQYQKLNTE
jgi:hypothetical protein